MTRFLIAAFASKALTSPANGASRQMPRDNEPERVNPDKARNVAVADEQTPQMDHPALATRLPRPSR